MTNLLTQALAKEGLKKKSIRDKSRTGIIQYSAKAMLHLQECAKSIYLKC